MADKHTTEKGEKLFYGNASEIGNCKGDTNKTGIVDIG